MGAMPATQNSNESDNTLQHFVTDLLSGLLEQLASRAKSMRKLVAAIFMLNNCMFARLNSYFNDTHFLATSMQYRTYETIS